MPQGERASHSDETPQGQKLKVRTRKRRSIEGDGLRTLLSPSAPRVGASAYPREIVHTAFSPSLFSISLSLVQLSSSIVAAFFSRVLPPKPTGARPSDCPFFGLCWRIPLSNQIRHPVTTVKFRPQSYEAEGWATTCFFPLF